MQYNLVVNCLDSLYSFYDQNLTHAIYMEGYISGIQNSCVSYWERANR